MKKINILWIAVVLFLIAACEKKDPGPVNTDPEIVQKQIVNDLSDRDDLNQFVDAFNSLEISSQDMAEGITIFAPVDDDARNARSVSDTTKLTPEVLKDHIVKSIIEGANLNDGDTLTTLNGEHLMVTVDGEEVRVNGVLISGKNIATNAKYVVHTVERILSTKVPQQGSGSIEVTVWNGAKWSPEHLKGEVEGGVTVSLYNSRAAFMQNKAAAYTAETQADGTATFTNIDVDKVYYISASKAVSNGTIDNSFYEQVQDTVYMGFIPDGIFQNQEEVDAYTVQANDAMVGNFRWKDINEDGLINGVDRVPLPFGEVNATSGQTVSIDVMIGYNNNRSINPAIRNQAEALQTLNTVYLNLKGWQEFLIIADGILSDDDAVCNAPDWCTLDNFSFGANHPIITNVWQGAYDNIGRVNLLLRDVPGLSFTEKDQVVAEAKGLRALIYLQLATYFGDVPLMAGLNFEGDITRVPEEDVFAFVSNDLTEVASILPSQWTSAEDLHRFNGDAAKVLLAKVAVGQQQWAVAADYTNEILTSGRYALMEGSAECFASVDNNETIWNNFAITPLSVMFSDYFARGTYFPTARLAEVYLMNAEAQNEMGLAAEASNSLNIIREREGMSAVAPGTPIEEFRELTIATWKTVMSREGSRFANLVRWGKAEEVLFSQGYQPHHNLLPLPQIVLDKHPSMLQNPGY